MLESALLVAALQVTAGEPGFDQIPQAIEKHGMKNLVVCPSVVMTPPRAKGGGGSFANNLVGSVVGGLVNQAISGNQGGGLPIGGIPGVGIPGGGFPGGGFPGGGFPGGGFPGGGFPGGGFPGGGFPGGGLGANINSMPQQLAGQLMGQGMLNVLNRNQATNVMGGFQASDLTNPRNQSMLRQRTNADALAVIEVTPDANKYCQTCRLYDLRRAEQDLQSNPNAQARPVEEFISNDEISLGTIGYGGASFEVWRPDDTSPVLALKNVGLEQLPAGTPVASTRASETKLVKHLTYFKENQKRNPLSDKTIPYRIEILVGGTPRELYDLNGEIFVQLDHGERFEIRTINSLKCPVRCGIWVDGINMINNGVGDTTPWNPGMVSDVQSLNSRIWFLWPESGYSFKGWTASDVASQREFVVDRPGNSLANTLGNTQRLGKITALFYQAGAELPKAKGIVEGPKIDFGGTFVRSHVGPMLAAMTINYRTASELKILLKPEIVPPPPSTDEATPFPVAAKPSTQSKPEDSDKK